MPHTRTANRRVARAVIGAAVLACAALPAAAQSVTSVRIAGADSVAWIVPRQSRADAESALRTRDGRVVLLLQDTTLVIQLTDRGLDRLFEDDRDTVRRSVGGRILASMVRAGVVSLLDHGIAYRLSALRRAYAEGNRLVLEDRAGERVFEGVEVRDRHVMDEFAPEEAERFAAAVNRALGVTRQ
jgi:hypothetical protein